jgi:hypothetical protein
VFVGRSGAVPQRPEHPTSYPSRPAVGTLDPDRAERGGWGWGTQRFGVLGWGWVEAGVVLPCILHPARWTWGPMEAAQVMHGALL